MGSKGKSEVEKYWRKLVEEWRSSDLSIKKFAQERKVVYKQLCLWRQRLDGGKTLKEISKLPLEKIASFAPVCVVDNNQNDEPISPANKLSMLEIVLLCGRTIRFNSNCQPEYLSSVVSKLEVC
jgi:hypothetical protein